MPVAPEILQASAS